MNVVGIIIKVFILGFAGTFIGLGLALASHNNGYTILLGAGLGMFMGFLLSYLDGDFMSTKERRLGIE